jgi:protein TonB
MRLWLELPAFGALAAGLHLALFAGLPGGAPDAAGDGGAGTLTLAGAAGEVEAMVATWEAPPAVAEAVTLRPPEGRDFPAPVHLVSGLSAPARPAASAAPRMPDLATMQPPRIVAEAPPPRAADKPPEVPATRPRARPEQVAAGVGATGLRGTRGEAPVSGLSDSARRSIVASWGAEIRTRIEARKVHPEGLRASGRPVVRITVARSGALEDVRVIRSSRVAALDEAAIRAVRRAGAFPAAPRELDLARVSFDLPIAFTR